MNRALILFSFIPGIPRLSMLDSKKGFDAHPSLSCQAVNNDEGVCVYDIFAVYLNMIQTERPCCEKLLSSSFGFGRNPVVVYALCK